MKTRATALSQTTPFKSRLAGLVGAVLLAVIWAGCGGPGVKLLDPGRPVESRPVHFGVSLPVPVSSGPVPAYQKVFGPPEQRIPVFLRVDRKGNVAGVGFATPADSLMAADRLPYLRTFKFVPGQRDGVPAEMVLRAELQTSGVGSEPRLLFPVGPNHEIERSELYWAAFDTVGFAPPRLIEFPSYYYQFDLGPIARNYDYKIYRVDLDSAGQVTAVEPVRVTAPRFTDQIRSAIVWARYAPMRVDGRPVVSSGFVVVALFPDIDYPTAPWSAASLAGLSAQEKLRVRFCPDTLAEMLPPVVRRDWSGPIVDTVAWEAVPEVVSARLAVDTAGASTLRELSVDSWKIRRTMIGRAFDRQFYPARDFHGLPMTWTGLAYARFIQGYQFKAWFDWVPEPDPGPGIHPNTVP